jgi:hypothetical protein
MQTILRRVILLLALTSAIALAAWPFSDPKASRKKARVQDNTLKKNMARQQ